jgi:hypothetical protein
MSKKPKKPTNLTEISFDIDGYVADGGKLSDLEVPTDEKSQSQVKAFARASASEETLHRMVRVGRFMERLGEVSPSEDAVIGSVLSEERLQRLWRETSPSH